MKNIILRMQVLLRYIYPWIFVFFVLQLIVSNKIFVTYFTDSQRLIRKEI